LTFAEQIGVDVKSILKLYERQWVSKILSLFAPFLRTRLFNNATYTTVNMSNEYADYGDESTCPDRSTVVPIEQQDSRNPLPSLANFWYAKRCDEWNERKRNWFRRKNKSERKARAEADAEAVLTRLAEQMRMEAEHDDKSVASITQQMGALSPTRNKKVDVDALTDLMGGLFSPHKINQVTATGTTPPDVDECGLSPKKGADTTTEHHGAYNAQTPATFGGTRTTEALTTVVSPQETTELRMPMTAYSLLECAKQLRQNGIEPAAIRAESD
jgi:hypothetical protein